MLSKRYSVFSMERKKVPHPVTIPATGAKIVADIDVVELQLVPIDDPESGTIRMTLTDPSEHAAAQSSITIGGDVLLTVAPVALAGVAP